MLTKLKNWFNKHLLDDWKQCYKWFSVHAATIGIALTVINEYYGNYMPQWCYTLMFVSVLLTRLIKQDSA